MITEFKHTPSTYGMVTAGRIFETYRIHLHADALATVMQTPDSFYYRLIRMPLKHVFNGIIAEQCQDYQNFAQKLFVDYLLAGGGNQSEHAGSSATKLTLEEKRQQLLQLGEQFASLKLQHEQQIAQSQVFLKRHAEQWQELSTQIIQSLHPSYMQSSMEQLRAAWTQLLVQHTFKSLPSTQDTALWLRVEQALSGALNETQRSEFIQQLDRLAHFDALLNESEQQGVSAIQQLEDALKMLRKQLRSHIIEIKELMLQSPDVSLNHEQIEQNLLAIQFNPELGEEISKNS